MPSILAITGHRAGHNTLRKSDRQRTCLRCGGPARQSAEPICDSCRASDPMYGRLIRMTPDERRDALLRVRMPRETLSDDGPSWSRPEPETEDIPDVDTAEDQDSN